MNALPDPVEVRSILVALDDSSCMTPVLEQAVAIATESGAPITLLHVVPPPHPPFFIGSYAAPLPPLPVVDDVARDEDAERLLARATAAIPEGIRVHAIVRHGPVATEILRRVAAAGHDLVVIGSRGRGPLRSLILGSVSRPVLHHSPVPVVIVHGADDAELAASEQAPRRPDEQRHERRRAHVVELARRHPRSGS